MRSVLITDTRYLSGNFERQVQPDELLQMFGRAGRRGLDDTGFILFTPDQPRLSFARPRQLKRATQVDWPSLISVMRGAAERGEQPFAAAVELSRSLFSAQRVALGVEHSLATGPKPCGLWVDAERARFVRRPIVEILNSRGGMGAARREAWNVVRRSASSGKTTAGSRPCACRKRSTAFRSGISAGCARRKSTAAKWPLATATLRVKRCATGNHWRRSKCSHEKSLPERRTFARVTADASLERRRRSPKSLGAGNLSRSGSISPR